VPEPLPRRGRPVAAILLIAAALAPGLFVPGFIDLDEALFAGAAKGFALEGDWLHPRWNGEPFSTKPPLFPWLSAVGFRLTGVLPAVPRGISLAALAASLALLARFVRRRAGAAEAEIAVWCAGAAALPFFLGRLGLLDSLLVALVSASLLLLREGIEPGGTAPPGARPLLLASGWLSVGFSCALKGPVFPLLVATILLVDAALRRDFPGSIRRSGAFWGAPLSLLVGLLPSFLVATADGGGTVIRFLLHDNLARLGRPLEGHGGPFFYYLVILVPALAPFTPLAVGAVARGLRSCAGANLRFAAVWAITVVGAFSLAATKLPHYVAPAVPAFALALAFAADPAPPSAAARREWGFAALFGGLLGILLAAIPFLLPFVAGRLDPALLRKSPELAVPLPLDSLSVSGFVLAGLFLASAVIGGRSKGLRGDRLGAFRALGAGAALAWMFLGLGAGRLLDRASILPMRELALRADASLPPGEPIFLVEMPQRVSPGLDTGRRLVHLRVRNEAARNDFAARLRGDSRRRAIVPLLWWDDLRPETGLLEIGRSGGWALVGGGNTPKGPPRGDPPTSSSRR
jgi:4-amino-4-deoxy-L-arabinose transferase-like glycosyltransferase